MDLLKPNNIVFGVFKEFAEISGLKISMEKSTIYLAGVSETETDLILNQFRFDHGSLPVRYLGLPLLTKRMTAMDYNPLIEKVRSRISSWTARHLSSAGRLQLIGSVIHSLTNFWISAFRLPKACIREIDKLCAAFLWSGPELNTKKTKVAWREVCKPKEEGGLGLRSIAEANIVSCLKLVWKILSERSSLWVCWIYRYLIRKGSYWTANIGSANGSWMWKKLLKLRPLAAKFAKVEIQNGAETSFWFDDWCKLGRIMELTGPRGCIDIGIPLNATVEMALNIHRRRRHRVDILNTVEEEIQKIRNKGLTSSNDVWLWKRQGNSYGQIFSSKHTLKVTRGLQPSVNWYKGVWFSFATPKYSVFTWLVTLNRLSTGDRVINWNLQLDPGCILCNHDMESRDHLYFNCHYTTQVWTELALGLFQTRYTTSWSRLLEVLLDSSMGKTRLFLCRYLLQVTTHTIWRERNGRKHGEDSHPPSVLVRNIDKMIRNKLSSLQSEPRFRGALQVWFEARS